MDRKWICYWLEFCVLSAGPIQAKWHFNMDSRHEHWALTLFIRFHVHDWFLYWLLCSISWWTLKMSTSTCSCKWMKTIELFKFIVCGYRCNDAWNSRAFSVWRTWSWWYHCTLLALFTLHHPQKGIPITRFIVIYKLIYLLLLCLYDSFCYRIR